MPEVEGREVVRCDSCQLVQFMTESNLCRKPSCRASLLPEPESIPKVRDGSATPVPAPVPTQQPTIALLGDSLARLLRVIRQAEGLSQRDLAVLLEVPRTYLSKIDRGIATPTLASILRLCAALNVRPDALMYAVEIGAQ